MNLFDSAALEKKGSEMKEESKNSLSLNNTTEKSIMQPEQLLKEQSDALKKVSAERNRLLREGRPEDQATIQSLSSEKSELTSLVQNLTRRMQEQTERIEMLSESDRQLKQAKKLKKDAEKMKKYAIKKTQDAESLISDCKQKYDEKVSELADDYYIAMDEVDYMKAHAKEALDRAMTKESAASKKFTHLSAEIDKTATALFDERQKELETKYIAYTTAYDSLLIWSLLYGIISTIAAITLQAKPAEDLTLFLFNLWRYIKLVFCGGFKIVYSAFYDWNFDNATTEQQIGLVLLIVVFTVFIWALGYGPVGYFVGYKTYTYIRDKADMVTLLVALGSLIICVYLGTWIRTWLPVNLTLLWILIQYATAGGRWLYRRYKE